MSWNQPKLSQAESTSLRLRGLYEQFGYRKYHVGQFEEYELYMKFHSFLTGGRILSFTDLDGRLLALKPDITLSIAKNARLNGCAEKSYYIENVYRESAASGMMKEINQMGLEYLGGDSAYTQAEVLYLALESLKSVGPEYVLELSHMGFLQGLFDALGLSGEARNRVLSCLSSKSVHGVAEEARRAGIGSAGVDALCALCTLSGSFSETLGKARDLCLNGRMTSALEELAQAAAATDGDEHLRLDFTLQGDMEYYDGLMMAGYLAGAPRAVLYGGRYDGLMKKLGRDVSAVGFALYLDELKVLPREHRENDVDVLLLAPADADPVALMRAVRDMTRQGLSVRVEAAPPEGLRYGRLVRYGEEDGIC